MTEKKLPYRTALSFRAEREIFPLSFASTYVTTRSLAGVYAEFNEVLEMTCCITKRRFITTGAIKVN